MAASDKPVGGGHVMADLSGPRFRAIAKSDAEGPAGIPIHNSFGRLKVVSMRDNAEAN